MRRGGVPLIPSPRDAPANTSRRLCVSSRTSCLTRPSFAAMVTTQSNTDIGCERDEYVAKRGFPPEADVESRERCEPAPALRRNGPGSRGPKGERRRRTQ